MKLNLKQILKSRSDVSKYLISPGDAVLVDRGGPRWLILACPCGCGEEIPVNLDSRSGPAWRLYSGSGTKKGLSLYPSVWRDTGCGSHFIIRHDRIDLFGSREQRYWDGPESQEVNYLAQRVLPELPTTGYASFLTIADRLDNEVPWDVLDACHVLVKSGLAIEGSGTFRGNFRRL